MRTVLLAMGMLPAALAAGQPLGAPPIEWQQALGGAQRDSLYELRELDDGGFIAGGVSDSQADGTKTARNFGATDYWVVRLDSQGNPLWDRSFGGSSFDYLWGVQETAQGGFIVVGASSSGTNGNKTSPRYSTNRTEDAWVIGLDREGNKVWEQSYGGTADDWLRKIVPTSDGGFFLCGLSGSQPSTDKTSAAYGRYDFWVVRIDERGLRLWDRSFGGNDHDGLWAAQRTLDGGVLLGGTSLSPPSGNKGSQHFGDYDFWVVRLDAEGNKLWDVSFGGVSDDTLYCLGQMPDGGFIAAGRSSSPVGGNKSSPNLGDYYDFWVVRLDANGNKLWDRTFGGSQSEYPYSMDVTRDGGVILGGWSNSPVSGNKTATNYFAGGVDGWVVRLDADGNKLWDATYGGSRSDALYAVQQTRDGGFILGAQSPSPADGNKTVPQLGFFEDFWLIKLGAEMPQLRLVPLLDSGSSVRISLTGIKNLSYAVDRSSDLALWIPLQTNRMTSSTMELLDAPPPDSSQRFYRAREVGSP